MSEQLPIYALLAQFRIMEAVNAPLSAWQSFERELVRECARLRESGGLSAPVDRQYLDEAAVVLAAVSERVAKRPR